MKFQVLLCALAFSVTACAQTTSGTHAASQGEFAPTQVPPLPAKLEFAGEAVPLGNYDTRESLTREMLTTLYMHSRTMQTLLASERYFAIIEPILKKYGVPDDFKDLCMAESGLNPEARSGAGAAGLWQLMPAYAKSAGLLVGGEVDERYHVEKSTEAACQYLVDAKRRLGSWTLAAASFNAGVAGVSRRLEKQGVTSYYDLFLPSETLRYVFRVLSFKLLVGDPGAYGYRIGTEDYYKPLPEYKEVTVDSPTIDWTAFARGHGTNYKLMRELNPWIRDYDHNNKAGRSYVVKIPADDSRK